MYKQKIGISILNTYQIATTKVVKMVKEIGFEAISPMWGKQVDLAPIIETARECGLIVQSIHGPYKKVNTMWGFDSSLSAEYKEELKQAIRDCSRFQVPILVVHAWIGFDYTFDPNQLNFKEFDEVITYAASLGVMIAFENTEGEEYIHAILEHYRENPYVGFCWDSGHEMCYNHSHDLLLAHGEQLIMTHLNDNLGIRDYEGRTHWMDDLHLLPYDGVADWDYNIERLKKAKKQEILNVEVKNNSHPNRHENELYEQMRLQVFLTEAYKRACKIAYRYANVTGKFKSEE